MSAKNIYKVLAILMGYGLIIGGFCVFGENLEKNIRILDIIVCCVLFTQFIEFTLFPLVNLDEAANKEVGMMGIHFTTIDTCAIISILIMVLGIAYDWPFKYQLMGQLIVLFILLCGRVATLTAGDKVEQIYHKEQNIMEGKKNLRLEMDNFMDDIAVVKDLDPAIKQRLEKVHEAMRYLSPSDKVEAKTFDSKIIQSLDELLVMTRNVTVNKTKIEEEVDRLERTVARRKKY